MLSELLNGEMPDRMNGDLAEIDSDPAEIGDSGGAAPDGKMPGGRELVVGTPDGGTTQSATGSSDAITYESYADMVAAYKEDIQELPV